MPLNLPSKKATKSKNHCYWSLILKSKGVQKRFTRMIKGVGLLPLYSERLEILNLTTLIERQTCGDLIEIFKAEIGYSNMNGGGCNLLSSIKIYSGSAKLRKVKRNYINERVISYWNSQYVDNFKIN